jgi:hypothetical protein
MFGFSKSWRDWCRESLKTERRKAAYTRVQAFLLSYVFLAAGPNKTNLLDSQMSLWSSARAIAMAMLAVAVEVPIVLVLSLSAWISYGWSAGLILGVSFAEIALMSLGIGVALGAYQRFCGTLLALTYIVSQGEHKVRPVGADALG